MREILFKGKAKDDNKWVQGYIYKIWERAFIVWGMVNEVPDMIEIDPKTISEYTGLKDYNGRPIFENDIIRFHDEVGNWGKDGVVLFEQGEFRYRMKTDDPDLYNCRICGEEDRFNVIGNIYDM